MTHDHDPQHDPGDCDSRQQSADLDGAQGRVRTSHRGQTRATPDAHRSPGVHPEHPGTSEPQRPPDDRRDPMSNRAMAGQHHDPQMVRSHHRRTLWVWWTILGLGVWLIAAALSFDYALHPAEPSGGRQLWLSLEARASAMFWSDLVSGAMLVVLGWRLLTPGRAVTQWLACFVGVWLTFAPLVFWSPTAWAYVNDTFVGALVIALTILIPGMPGMMTMMVPGPDKPPGWSYNPSSWPQRWIMILLAFAGWMVSRYLAAFQLGYTSTVAEPFFGDGTLRVLNSRMSHLWPISDAALGALSYTFEFLMGWMGSPARWRTMPWMVVLFGVLVVPLGLTHIILVISQPIVVGHWCTLCLLAAAIMLPMIPLTLDEVVAMCQFLRKAVWRDGKRFWRTFWMGDTLADPDEAAGAERSMPDLHTLPQQPWRVLVCSTWGVSAPWNLVMSTLIGLWLMFAPAVFGTSGFAADTQHLAGAMLVTTSVIAMAEVVRAGRFLNVPLGLWLVATPLLFGGDTVSSAVNAVICGLSVTALSIPRGRIRDRYGTWQAWVV